MDCKRFYWSFIATRLMKDPLFTQRVPHRPTDSCMSLTPPTFIDVREKDALVPILISLSDHH